MRSSKGIIAALLVILSLSGCNKSNNKVEESSSSYTENSTITSVTELRPTAFIQNYDIYGKVGGEVTFTITNRGNNILKAEDFIFPEYFTAEVLIFNLDNGDIEVMLFNMQGLPGKYNICIKSDEFNNGIELEIPLVLQHERISDNVHLNCAPSTTEVTNGGMVTGLLNYSGEISQMNLGEISITLYGFTADVSVTLSSSNSHMLTLSNIIKTANNNERTYFDICEGTAYDNEGKPCNGCEIDLIIEG